MIPLYLVFGEPPMRADGRCAVCLRSRPKPAVALGDRFCSSECAGVWHRPEARAGRAFLSQRRVAKAAA